MDFPHGILIGLLLAVPIGPMALLCIDRTLASGRKAGFVIGLGIATADLIGAFVVTFLYKGTRHFISEYTPLLALGGSLVLMIVGYRLMVQKQKSMEAPKTKSVFYYFEALFLTLINPILLFSFIAVVASAHIHPSGLFVLGVFCGSFLWWAMITFFTSIFGYRLSPKAIRRIHFFSGLAIMLLGFINGVRVLQ